jgi:hypothetical protein
MLFLSKITSDHNGKETLVAGNLSVSSPIFSLVESNPRRLEAGYLCLLLISPPMQKGSPGDRQPSLSGRKPWRLATLPKRKETLETGNPPRAEGNSRERQPSPSGSKPWRLATLPKQKEILETSNTPQAEEIPGDRQHSSSRRKSWRPAILLK